MWDSSLKVPKYGLLKHMIHEFMSDLKWILMAKWYIKTLLIWVELTKCLNTDLSKSLKKGWPEVEIIGVKLNTHGSSCFSFCSNCIRLYWNELQRSKFNNICCISTIFNLVLTPISRVKLCKSEINTFFQTWVSLFMFKV